MFLRYAPPTVSAFDKIHREEQEREQRKQRASQSASQPQGPRFSGR